MNRIIKNALISVSDKSDLVPLAQFLINQWITIYSTGGTSKILESFGIPYKTIESLTKNPECFDGRMKSISFSVASGILYRRDHIQDELQMHQLGFTPIDMVVCNFYPFKQKADSNENLLIDELIEEIDVGGPLMVRASAKNFKDVLVLTSSDSYQEFMHHYHINKSTTYEYRKKMAKHAFKMVHAYDNDILNRFDNEFNIKLRYGENPHQNAKLEYNHKHPWKVLGGKELSYNNILDSDSAWRCISELTEHLSDIFPYACVVIKHGNPCGAVMVNSPEMAMLKAWEGGGISSFGSVVAINFELTENVLAFFDEKFVEVIIAPKVSININKISSSKKNLRFVETNLIVGNMQEKNLRSTFLGTLIQDEDKIIAKRDDFKCVTKRLFPSEYNHNVIFGLIVTKYLKSNAVSLISSINQNAIKVGVELAGAGMGQPNRLDSFELLSLNRAKNRKIDLSQTLLVSDAFFPFADIIESAAKENINYIVQPGGSIQDNTIIEKANEFNMSMIFTGKRHFRH